MTLHLDKNPRMCETLRIAFGGFPNTGEVVTDEQDQNSGIYRATEYAVLSLAYYNNKPMYKLINGEVIACMSHEFDEPEITQDKITSSKIYGKGDAQKRQSAKGLTHGPEKWDYIECRDEIMHLFAERQKRGDSRI